MNFKTTYILFGTLALIIIVFGVAVLMIPGPDTTSYVLSRMRDTTDPIQPGQINEVIIERERPKEEKWVFVRNADTNRWTITEPRKMRADGRTIERLLDQIYNAQRLKDADKPSDLSQWGLKPPAQTITLKKGDTEVQLKIGDETPGEQWATIYVMDGDRPREPMAVKKTALSEVLQGLVAYRERELLSSAQSDVVGITLSETDKGKTKNSTVQLAREKERWKYQQPFTGDADVEGDTSVAAAGQPPSGVQGLLTELTDLKVESNADKDKDFIDNVSDLSKYGLGKDDDVFRIKIDRIDKITRNTEGDAKEDKDKKKDKKEDKKEVETTPITLLVAVGAKVDDKGKKGDKADRYYAVREGEKDVVQVAAKNVDPLRELLTKPDALRDRHLVRLDNRQPDALNVKNAHGTLEFRRPDSTKPWQLYRDDKPQPSTDAAIAGLLSQLKDRRKDITFEDKPDESKLGLDKPAAVVSLWIDGLAPEEKKEDKEDDKKDDKKLEADKKKSTRPKLKDPNKPTFKLTFAPPAEKAKDVVVKREAEGEETAYLRVPIVIYERVAEGPLFYMDKKLPQYDPGSFEPAKDVTKLVIDQGGTVTELTHEKKADAPWKIVKPSALKDRDADPFVVQNILRQLNDLRALDLIKETKGDELDKDYGLDEPQAKVVVTVTKDGKPEESTYVFSKKEKAGAIYARQSQRGMIFTVDKGLVKAFEEPILDKTVFKFDPSKAKTVKLVGWYSFAKTPITIEAEHKDGKWVRKGGKPDLDSRKFEDLVNTLSNLRAEKFLPPGTKPKPEHELDVEKGALEITVTVEGEDKPFTLTIGKAEDNGYVALSNRLADVFIVSKFPFEGPLTKPAYFSNP